MGGASRPPEFAPSFHVKVMRPGASQCRAWRQEDAPVRRFNFEAEVYESLSCVPMAVRRKLDRAGVKVGLKQWRALGRGEPPSDPPGALVEQAGILGFALDTSVWRRLDGDERYALMKLGTGPKL